MQHAQLRIGNLGTKLFIKYSCVGGVELSRVVMVEWSEVVMVESSCYGGVE